MKTFKRIVRLALLFLNLYACDKKENPGGDPSRIFYSASAILVDSGGNQLFNDLDGIPFFMRTPIIGMELRSSIL